jgi:hypothetical protein
MWKSRSKKGKNREENVKEELQIIGVEFPQNPEQPMAVCSRLKLDLPEEIVGFVQWYKSSKSAQEFVPTKKQRQVVAHRIS